MKALQYISRMLIFHCISLLLALSLHCFNEMKFWHSVQCAVCSVQCRTSHSLMDVNISLHGSFISAYFSLDHFFLMHKTRVIRKYMNTQIPKYTDTQIHKYTNLRIHKNINTHIHKYTNATPQIQWSKKAVDFLELQQSHAVWLKFGFLELEEKIKVT